MPNPNPKLNRAEMFLFNDAPNTTENLPVVSLIPVPSREVLRFIKNAIQSSNNFRSVKPPYAQDQLSRYPLWLVTFWDEIAPGRIAHDRWGIASRIFAS